MQRTTRRNVSAQVAANDIPGYYEDTNETEYLSEIFRIAFNELVNAILDRNTDPIIDRMLRALIDKIPMLTTEKIEKKRGRSIVLVGMGEPVPNLRSSYTQNDLEEKAFELLEALDVWCRSSEIRRIERPEPNRARLVKGVFLTNHELFQALSRA